MTPVRMLAAVLVVLMLPSGAFAQTPTAWDSIELHGRSEYLAASAGWPVREPERTRLLRDILRFLNNRSAPRQRESTALSKRLEEISVVHATIAALGKQPLTFKTTDSRQLDRWRKLFDILGYELRVATGRPPIARPRSSADAVSFRQRMTQAGLDHDRLIPALLAGESTSFGFPVTKVPLPLGLETWSRRVLRKELTPDSLFRTLVENRTAALFYIGLTGLDSETLGWFAADDALIETAFEQAMVFAEFSRSLRVRNGRLVLPLEAEAGPLWSRILNTALDDPRRVMTKIIKDDGGRRAWYFDTLVQLDPPRQRYAMCLWLPVRDRQRCALETYDWFSLYKGSNTLLRAFSTRDGFDPALALAGLTVNSDGTPAAPSDADFVSWALAQAEIGREASGPIGHVRPADGLRPNLLLDTLFAEPASSARSRAEALYFGQRIAKRFNVTPTELATIMRGHLRFPALVRTFDRLPSTGARPLLASIQRAEALRQQTDREAYHVTVRQFQGALGVIAACSLAGSLDADQTSAAIETLAAIEPTGSGYYLGALADWMFGTFTEALRQGLSGAGAPEGSIEDLLVRGLAGMAGAGGRPVVNLNGFEYRLESSAFQYDRIRTIRQKQGQAGEIDAVAALTALSRALPEATAKDDLKGLSLRVENLGQIALAQIPSVAFREMQLNTPVIGTASRDLILGQLPPAQVTSMTPTRKDGVNELPSIAELRTVERSENVWKFKPRAALNEATRSVRTLRPGRAGDVSVAREDIGLVLDWSMASLLPKLIYAAQLPDADDPLLLGGDVSVRHNFGTFRADRRIREAVTWSLPVTVLASVTQWECPETVGWAACTAIPIPQEGIPWHVEGALLGLDLLFGLPTPSMGPREGVASAFIYADQDLAALRASSLFVGRGSPVIAVENLGPRLTERRKQLLADPTSWARRPSWRAAAVSWAAVNEPEAIDMLVLPTELLDDESPGLEIGGLDAVTGCLCQTPWPVHGADFRWTYAHRGYFAAAARELEIRIRELLADVNLPGAAVAMVFGAALHDVLLQATPGDMSDWLSLTREIGRLTRERLDDYLAHFTRVGLLRVG